MEHGVSTEYDLNEIGCGCGLLCYNLPTGLPAYMCVSADGVWCVRTDNYPRFGLVSTVSKLLLPPGHPWTLPGHLGTWATTR